MAVTQSMRTSSVISLDFHCFLTRGFTMQFQNWMSFTLAIPYPQGSEIQRQVSLTPVLLPFASTGQQAGRATGLKVYVLRFWPNS